MCIKLVSLYQRRSLKYVVMFGTFSWVHFDFLSEKCKLSISTIDAYAIILFLMEYVSLTFVFG